MVVYSYFFRLLYFIHPGFMFNLFTFFIVPLHNFKLNSVQLTKFLEVSILKFSGEVTLLSRSRFNSDLLSLFNSLLLLMANFLMPGLTSFSHQVITSTPRDLTLQPHLHALL